MRTHLTIGMDKIADHDTGGFQQIEELYHSALERPPAERAAFLRDCCVGDESLRNEVESLLAQRTATLEFMEFPALNLVVEQMAGDSGLAGNFFNIGQTVSHYRILEKLGEGGMGVVYRARDPKLSRSVAVKVLSEDFRDPGALLRFQREAQLASSLNHPHILTVYDAGESEGIQYLVTEFADGGTLSDWASAERRTWRQVVELLVGVADGLATAHTAGILHRDIKPSNVLVTKNRYAKLADFGLAKLEVRSTPETTAQHPPHSRGSSWAPSPTCRLSRPRDAQSTAAAISFHSVCCFTSFWLATDPSRPKPI